ncbi:hypothetical protein B4589_002220 [Halolamina sp. CBA1230]|nr:hypothetical protein B4589_002220 [Halolamina sp. CBA1230]
MFGDFLLEPFEEFDHSGEIDFFYLIGSMALVPFRVLVGVVVPKYGSPSSVPKCSEYL